jgi:hypothetical protein
MPAPTAYDAIVWPEPSPLQQWWARVMGATRPPDAAGQAPAVVRNQVSETQTSRPTSPGQRPQWQ